MTWFSKTAAFWSTLLLLGFGLEGLSSHETNTLYNCKQDCRNETDDHLCSRRMTTEDGSVNGKPVALYRWLRNECEMKCYFDGENQRVEMEHCTKVGQNITAYTCEEWYGVKRFYQRCMRNETIYQY